MKPLNKISIQDIICEIIKYDSIKKKKEKDITEGSIISVAILHICTTTTIIKS